MTREIITDDQALAITGQQWKVNVYKDGNHRRLVRVLYVKAPTRQRAELLAREISGYRVVIAYVYRPWLDLAICRFVRKVD